MENHKIHPEYRSFATPGVLIGVVGVLIGIVGILHYTGTLGGHTGLFGKKNESFIFRNRYGVIVSSNNESTLSEDKFQRPTICFSVLIRDILDTTMFTTLNCHNFKLPKGWYYNKKIGDTVFFKKIRKDRYFKIFRK